MFLATNVGHLLLSWQAVVFQYMCIILVILIFRRFVVLWDFSTSSLPWRLRGNLVVLFNV